MMLTYLRKMQTLLTDPVTYHLQLGQSTLELNKFLGKKISLHYSGKIYCIQCQRATRKSFQQGYCYPCYKRLLECNLCVIHPERCRFYENNCCADDWAHQVCGQEHVVYLANSSGVKVGITRRPQLPTRWIDQGASQGLPIMQAKNRHQVGQLEVVLKQYVADKTHWQAMLKFKPEPQDLRQKWHELRDLAQLKLAEIMSKFPADDIQYIDESETTLINYPILEYPQIIRTLDFDKTPNLEGSLLGIKGQYLLLDTGVINLRKFSGYEFSFS